MIVTSADSQRFRMYLKVTHGSDEQPLEQPAEVVVELHPTGVSLGIKDTPSVGGEDSEGFSHRVFLERLSDTEIEELGVPAEWRVLLWTDGNREEPTCFFLTSGGEWDDGEDEDDD